MSSPIFITVGTATPAVSQAFTLERADRAVVVEVPSLTSPGELRPQFSSASGGPFWTLQRDDGSGVSFTAHSGSGSAIAVLTPLTPWGRFSFTGSVILVSTLTVYTTR